MEEHMDFKKMTLEELTAEMNNFRNQLEKQNYPATPAQKRRWVALKNAYKELSAYLAK